MALDSSGTKADSFFSAFLKEKKLLLVQYLRKHAAALSIFVADNLTSGVDNFGDQQRSSFVNNAMLVTQHI